jgi:acyl-coenzyme A synthetase/AMP-(fatty) acid ligase
MQPYLMSPRNTAAAIIKMLKETSCHKMLTTQETLKSLVSEIKLGLEGDTGTGSYHLEIIEMPPLSNVFPRMGVENIDDNFDEYPKAPTRPSLDQTMLYLHSSGSTGMPKSIRQSFRAMCNWAALREFCSENALSTF